MTITFDLQPTLSDELIDIMPLKEDDLERLFAVASDALIWEQHPANDRYKREVFTEYFNGAIESKGAFIIIEKASNEVMGSTRFYDLNLSKSQVAIGFTFLARKYWGGNYNHSMKRLLLHHAFKYVDTVLLHVGISNIRSQKAVEKIGGVKRLLPELDKDGNKPSSFEYEITIDTMRI